MKLYFVLSALFILTVSADKCGKKETAGNKFKAKLETKALCMNYTLRLLEGKVDTSLVVSNWTNESTGKQYSNVFGLGNPCDFPDSIKEGDEFYFTIDTSRIKDCMVCMAYYPTPSKKISIKVIPQ